MLQVAALGRVNLDSTLFLAFDAHVDVASAVDLDFTVPVADRFQSCGWLDEIWNEFVAQVRLREAGAEKKGSE